MQAVSHINVCPCSAHARSSGEPKIAAIAGLKGFQEEPWWLGHEWEAQVGTEAAKSPPRRLKGIERPERQAPEEAQAARR